MTAGKAYAFGALVAALSLVGWLAFSHHRRGSRAADGASALASGSAGPRASTSAPPPWEPSAAGTAHSLTPAMPPYTEPVHDRARADALRKLLFALYASRLEPAADAGVPSPTRMPAPAATGNQADKALGQYVARVMREQFVPLAGSCYEELLSRHPEARGNVTLKFSIMGDDAAGGVVVDAALGKGAKLGDEQFAVCVEESLYSVVFEPPPTGHPTVTVEQSLELAP